METKKDFKFVVRVKLAENPTERGLQPDHWTAEGLVDKAYVRDYIREAVSTWGGQYPPNHPMFPTNLKVSIIPMNNPTRAKAGG